MTRRGGQYLSFDSQSQVECVGTSPGGCDVATYGYDAGGTLAYEIAGGETRIFVEDLFVWNKSNNQATAHIFANGRQVGELQRDNASLRSGWFPPGWMPPVDPDAVLWPALGATSLLLLVLGWRSGSIALIASRPYRASTAILTGMAVLSPAPALAGGGNGTVSVRLTHHDHLGTRVLLVSDTPDVVYRRVFEPFGEVVAESLGTESQTRYLTGKRESVATREGTGPGLVNFGARWYDPEIGRFLSIDPIIQALGDPQTHNPYGYVRNNPIGLVDPNGMGWEDKLVKQIVGGLVIAIGLYIGDIGSITYGIGLILSTASDPQVAAAGGLVQAIGANLILPGIDTSISIGTPPINGGSPPLSTDIPVFYSSEAGGGSTGATGIAEGASERGRLAAAVKDLVEASQGNGQSEGGGFELPGRGLGARPETSMADRTTTFPIGSPGDTDLEVDIFNTHEKSWGDRFVEIFSRGSFDDIDVKVEFQSLSRDTFNGSYNDAVRRSTWIRGSLESGSGVSLTGAIREIAPGWGKVTIYNRSPGTVLVVPRLESSR